MLLSKIELDYCFFLNLEGGMGYFYMPNRGNLSLTGFALLGCSFFCAFCFLPSTSIFLSALELIIELKISSYWSNLDILDKGCLIVVGFKPLQDSTCICISLLIIDLWHFSHTEVLDSHCFIWNANYFTVTYNSQYSHIFGFIGHFGACAAIYFFLNIFSQCLHLVL